MDAYDRCTNLGKKILLIVLPSLVKAENLYFGVYKVWSETVKDFFLSDYYHCGFVYI